MLAIQQEVVIGVAFTQRGRSLIAGSVSKVRAM